MGLPWVRTLITYLYLYCYATTKFRQFSVNHCSRYTTLDFSYLAGQDYQAVTNMRLGPFGNSDRRQCFDVNITNDAEPEDPEDFMIIVQFCPGEAQPERIHIDPQTATTTIVDDDGEFQ